MKNLEESRAEVAALKEEISGLADKPELSAEEEARFEAALLHFDSAKADLAAGEERAKKVAEVRATVTDTAPGFDAPNVRRSPAEVDVRTASRRDIRDAAMRKLEAEGRHLAPFQKDHLEQLINTRNENVDGAEIAKRMLLTETDAYRSAFKKAVTQSTPAFSPEEARAIDEFRAANEGTGSAGGFGVPVLIDPTIILTSGAADAPVLQISRMVTITTSAWKGVSSAGVSWSYDAESSAVSDDTPTLAQPSIPAYAARGFIPYSIEVGQDYPGFADEMGLLLNQGYLDLVAKQTCVGSGSSQPTGIFTAMTNATTTPAHVVVTTSGTLGGVDIRNAWAALPERYRSRATWVMSPTVEGKIRALGNSSNWSLADFTVNLTQDGSSVLTGRPVVVTDYAPAFTGTTGAANYAVVGDFSNFLIVQRAGMTVELVNHLFDTSTGRPTGQRGWFAYARHGFDSVNSLGFRLIANS